MFSAFLDSQFSSYHQLSISRLEYLSSVVVPCSDISYLILSYFILSISSYLAIYLDIKESIWSISFYIDINEFKSEYIEIWFWKMILDHKKSDFKHLFTFNIGDMGWPGLIEVPTSPRVLRGRRWPFDANFPKILVNFGSFWKLLEAEHIWKLKISNRTSFGRFWLLRLITDGAWRDEFDLAERFVPWWFVIIRDLGTLFFWLGFLTPLDDAGYSSHSSPWFFVFWYPLVNVYIAMENGHRNSGFSH